MDRDERQQTWAGPGHEKMPFNSEKVCSVLDVLNWESRNSTEGMVFTGICLCCSETQKIDGATEHLAQDLAGGLWAFCWMLLAVEFPSPAHTGHATLCATGTPEGCAYWWIHSLAQHTRDIPLKTTFFYWLVHLLLVKYKSSSEEKVFFY